MKLEAEIEENIGLLGILTDVQNKDTAQKIVDQVNLKMPNVLFSEGLYKGVERVKYIPYIYFVDKEGKAINVELAGKKDLEALKDAIQIALKSIE